MIASRLYTVNGVVPYQEDEDRETELQVGYQQQTFKDALHY